MQHEIGKIVEGKVTGITKFGAFIELEDGSVGMVHISEVSSTYVNDISEHLKEQQIVKVKIMNISDDGKISLSIKKALPPVQAPNRENKPNFNKPKPNFQQRQNYNNNSSNARPNYNNKNNASSQTKGPASFEDMLSKFMSTSEEKFSDLKKPTSNRRGNNRKSFKDYD